MAEHNYKIAIKNPNGGFAFVKEKVEEMKKEVVTNEDGEDIIVEVPTGKYAMQEFSRTTFEEAKEKYIELLNEHLAKDLNLVDDCTEKVTFNVELSEEESDVEDEVPVETDGDVDEV